MDLHIAFNSATGSLLSHAPLRLSPSYGLPLLARARNKASLFLPARVRKKAPAPIAPVIDARATEVHPRKRSITHVHPDLSQAMLEALAPGENVLGVGKFHYIYAVYTLLISGLLWALALPAGRQLQETANEVATNLRVYQASGEVDFLQLAQVFAILGYSHIAQLLALLGSQEFSWLTGEIAYQKALAFFTSRLWSEIPTGILEGMALFYLLFRMLKQWRTEIVVTNRRLLYKHGILIVRTLKSKLSQLERVDVNQTWLGDLLGYGSIHIFTHAWQTHGKGKDEHLAVEGIFLPAVAHPQRLSTLIDAAREAQAEIKETPAILTVK